MEEAGEEPEEDRFEDIEEQLSEGEVDSPEESSEEFLFMEPIMEEEDPRVALWEQIFGKTPTENDLRLDEPTYSPLDPEAAPFIPGADTHQQPTSSAQDSADCTKTALRQKKKCRRPRCVALGPQ